MKPDTIRTERFGSQWMELGYQGKDPATDYRGMGILGLHNLHYFARNDTQAARRILVESNHPIYWYSFAIAGINFTAELFDQISLFKRNDLFYNAHDQDILTIFSELYLRAFRQFHEFWKQEEATVMQFNDKRKEFFLQFS
jgi:hypothetical protein